MGEPLSEDWKPPQLNLANKSAPDLALINKESTALGISPVARSWELTQAARPKQGLIFSPDGTSLGYIITIFVSGGLVALLFARSLVGFFGFYAVNLLSSMFATVIDMIFGGRITGLHFRGNAERRRLRAVKSWRKLHRDELRALLTKVSAFNQAISAFNEGYERQTDVADDDLREAAREALQNQRLLLQGEVDRLVDELEEVEERAKLPVVDEKAKAKAARHALEAERRLELKEQHRRLKEVREAFAKNVELWQKLDRGLAGGADNGRYDKTQDISALVYSIAWRRRLEAECVELGLPLSSLPESAVASRLPAKSGG